MLALAAPLTLAACVDPFTVATGSSLLLAGTAALVSVGVDLAAGETVPTGAYGRRQTLDREDGVSVVAIQRTIRRADRDVIRAARSASLVATAGIDRKELARLAGEACG